MMHLPLGPQPHPSTHAGTIGPHPPSATDAADRRRLIALMCGVKIPVDQNALRSLSSAAAASHGAFLIGITVPSDRILYAVPRLPVPLGSPPHAWHAEHARAILNMLPGGLTIVGIFTTGRDADRVEEAHHNLLLPGQSIVLYPGSNNAAVPLAKKIQHEAGDTVAWKSVELRSTPSLSNRCVVLRGTLHFPRDSLFISTAAVDVDHSVHSAQAIARRLIIAITPKSVSGQKDEEEEQAGPILVVRENDGRVIADTLGYEKISASSGKALKGSKKKTSSAQPEKPILQQDVDVFVPFTGATNLDYFPKGSSQDDDDDIDPVEAKLWRLSGSLATVAVVSHKATLGDALRAMRDDAVRSLKARLDLFHETRLAENIKKIQHPPYKLPTRILAFQSAGSLPVVDYLAKDETIDDDVACRLVDVLSWTESQLDRSKLDSVESEAEMIVEETRDEKRGYDNKRDGTKRKETRDEETRDVAPSPEPITLNKQDSGEADEPIEELSQILVYGVSSVVILAIIAIIIRQIM